MIKNNEKTLDDTVVININNGMSQPTYSNNKGCVEKFKKKILGFVRVQQRRRDGTVVSFDMPRESKRKKPDSIRISGSC
jgi:hypothetical protein